MKKKKTLKTKPKYQTGGIHPPLGQASRQDSLDVYNQSVKVANYFNNKNYDVFKPQYSPITGYTELLRKDRERFSQQDKYTGINGETEANMSDYYKYKNKNQFYQRESASDILDTRAPMFLYDNRITPSVWQWYLNNKAGDPLEGDEVNLYVYDPIAVKPYDMLTPAEKKLREQRYGTSSTTAPPKPYVPNYDTDLTAYLQKENKPSSFAERKKLATAAGITNYNGTAEQNIALLKSIQGKAEIPATLKTPVENTTTTATTPVTTTPTTEITPPTQPNNNLSDTGIVNIYNKSNPSTPQHTYTKVVGKDGTVRYKTFNTQLGRDVFVPADSLNKTLSSYGDDYKIEKKGTNELITFEDGGAYADGGTYNNMKILKTEKEQKLGLNDLSINEAFFPANGKRLRKFNPTKEGVITLVDETGVHRKLSPGDSPILTVGDVTEYRMGGQQDYKHGGELPKAQLGQEFTGPTLNQNNPNNQSKVDLSNINRGLSAKNTPVSDPLVNTQNELTIQKPFHNYNEEFGINPNQNKYLEDYGKGVRREEVKVPSHTINPYIPYIEAINFGLNEFASLKRERDAKQIENINQQLVQSTPDVVYTNDRQQRGDNQIFAEDGGSVVLEEGGEIELTEKELEHYRSLGYDFE